MSAAELDRSIETWIRPIDEASAAGIDCRHEPIHTELLTEISKLGSVTGGTVDWARVIELGDRILSQKSKDLLVAVYLAHALHRTQGLDGLTAGLSLIGRFLDTYGDSGYPTRQNARFNALDWYLRYTLERLASTDIGAAEPEGLARLAQATGGLSRIVRERFGEAAPATGPLQKAIERLAGDAARDSDRSGDTAADPGSVPGDAAAGALPTAPVQGDDRAGGEARQTAGGAASSPGSDPQQPAAAGPPSPAALAEPWLAPISPESPAGVDARYEPSHEAVRTEIAKLVSLTGESVNWDMVIKESDALLRNRSKDLLIAAYLAWGLYLRDGLRGLATGVALLGDLLDRYWDALFPAAKRNARARANAVSWLIERTDAIAEIQPAPADAEHLQLLEAAADRLLEQVGERFDDQSRPAVRPLLERIRRLRLSLPEEPAPAPPAVATRDTEGARQPTEQTEAAQQPERTGQRAMATGLPQQAPVLAATADEADLESFLDDTRAALLEAGSALCATDPASALGHRLTATARLLRVLESPDTEQGSMTIAPAPPADALAYLQQLCADASWSELLTESELLVSRFIFSLTAHRFGCLALKNLGERYAGAYRVWRGELAALLQRVPEIVDLRFSDGTPFADERTRQWIESEIATSGAAAPAPGSSGAAEAPLEVVGRARQALAGGDGAGALAMLQEAIAGTAAGRERFQLRLELAEACAAESKIDVAEGLYATLVEEVGARSLEEWEPGLAIRCYAGYYRLLEGNSAKNEDTTGKSSMMYRRLCRLDPAWALRRTS